MDPASEEEARRRHIRSLRIAYLMKTLRYDPTVIVTAMLDWAEAGAPPAKYRPLDHLQREEHFRALGLARRITWAEVVAERLG